MLVKECAYCKKLFECSGVVENKECSSGSSRCICNDCFGSIINKHMKYISCNTRFLTIEEEIIYLIVR